MKFMKYNLFFDSMTNCIIFVIEYKGQKFESKIESKDLVSNMIDLQKLFNILELNLFHKLPNYNFEIIDDEFKTNNKIKLKIIYSTDYVNFEEKIIFNLI